MISYNGNGLVEVRILLLKVESLVFIPIFFQDCLVSNQRILKLERYVESPGKDIII